MKLFELINSTKDIETIGKFIKSEKDNSTLELLLNCLVRSLQSSYAHQSLVVDFVMKLLKPNSDSKSKKQPNELIAPLLLKAISLFPHLSHLFYLYDKIIEFTDSVAYYCEELGKMIDVNGRPAYSLFSGAFFLLVRFIDKLGVS